MVFRPPQHGPLGWLEGLLRVGFDFASGPIPNNALSKFQTARSGLYAERGAPSSSALKGGASRARIGDSDRQS